MANTIIPGKHLINEDVDPNFTDRYVPEGRLPREVDVPHPSAYPAERRFDTIYPGTRASDEATTAALVAAREHDRSATAALLDVLLGKKDDT